MGCSAPSPRSAWPGPPPTARPGKSPSSPPRALNSNSSHTNPAPHWLSTPPRSRDGSAKVTMAPDATVPGGLGGCGHCGEGVEAQNIKLTDDGLFVGYLTSRETAAQLGNARSMGAMRADGWQRIPLIRMTNINLLPGDSSLGETIAGTKGGSLMPPNKSGAIDDRSLTFQVGTR